MIDTKRRGILAALGASAVLAPGLKVNLASANTRLGDEHNVVIVVFLRGGIDGLNLVVPTGGVDRGFYEEARASLSIATTGTYAALPLGSNFGLHPSAIGLHQLWQQNRLAIVHAAGMSSFVTRSHFDAQTYLELGTPGQGGIGTGWLARHLMSAPGLPAQIPLPAVAAGSNTPTSLLGYPSALTLSNASEFRLNTFHWSWGASNGDLAGHIGAVPRIPELWAGAGSLQQAGRQALNALDIVSSQDFSGYTPGNGASYPSSTFGNQMRMLAQMLRLEVGMRAATVDLGGWDTHEGQGTAGSGYHFFQDKVADLSGALRAFCQDLQGSHLDRVTVVVQSEFGRRVRQNANGGTDHGYGNCMMVLGGGVNGGQYYGTWPGLDPKDLFEYFGDLPASTDFRRIFSEILIRRLGNPRLGAVFPGYSNYSPLGIVQGPDLPPDYSPPSFDTVFSHGFE